MAAITASIPLVLMMRIIMTNNAVEYRKIACSCVTIHTLIPFIFMFPTVNRKILLVVVKSGWLPGRFAMTILTSGREARRTVFRIIGQIIIRLVAAYAGIGRIVVITMVTGSAIIGNGCMRAVQNIVIIVDREGRRHPARGRGMAHGAISWNIQGYVLRIGTCIESGHVTGRALRGRTGVSGCVALDTIDR